MLIMGTRRGHDRPMLDLDHPSRPSTGIRIAPPVEFDAEAIAQALEIAAISLDYDGDGSFGLSDLLAEARKYFGQLTTWTDHEMLLVLDKISLVVEVSEDRYRLRPIDTEARYRERRDALPSRGEASA